MYPTEIKKCDYLSLLLSQLNHASKRSPLNSVPLYVRNVALCSISFGDQANNKIGGILIAYAENKPRLISWEKSHFLIQRDISCFDYNVYYKCYHLLSHSWGDTCQIWMWFKEYNGYFCKIERFVYGETNERNFSNPHPRSMSVANNYGTLLYYFIIYIYMNTYIYINIPHYF